MRNIRGKNIEFKKTATGWVRAIPHVKRIRKVKAAIKPKIKVSRRIVKKESVKVPLMIKVPIGRLVRIDRKTQVYVRDGMDAFKVCEFYKKIMFIH